MGTAAFILGVVFAIFLWILYHKIFDVYYTNVLRQVVSEIIGALFAGILLAGLLLEWLGKALGTVGNFFVGLLAALFRVFIIVAAVVAVCLLAFILWLRANNIHPFQESEPQLEGEITEEEYPGIRYHLMRLARWMHQNRFQS